MQDIEEEIEEEEEEEDEEDDIPDPNLCISYVPSFYVTS
jgi:hypothetical protein